MQTRRERRHEDLFITVPLGELVPKDHILRCIDGVLDFGWLHDKLRDCYCPDNGRPSIDPESALRAMRDLPVRPAIRFALDCCARTHQAR